MATATLSHLRVRDDGNGGAEPDAAAGDGRSGRELCVARQCALLRLSRSSLYYEPKSESDENLAPMRRMDALHMECPFYGSRQMSRHLSREGPAASSRVGTGCAA